MNTRNPIVVGLALSLAVMHLTACGDDTGGVGGIPSGGSGSGVPGTVSGPSSGSGGSGHGETDVNGSSTDDPDPTDVSGSGGEPSDTTDPRVTDDLEGTPCPLDGTMIRCYGGPPETRNVGMCRDGFRTCMDGLWGACEGDVLPRAEACNGRDDSCNGIVDDGVTNACGGCGPVPEEICGNGLDDNCSGIIDEGCDCDDRTNQPCYSGPPSTLGVGDCRGGLMDCIDGVWGPCIGEVLPTEETCDGRDNSCNGIIDDGVRNACGDCIGNEPEEVCDGTDTNCNGVIDDGLRVLPCDRCPDDIFAEEQCGDDGSGTGYDDNCSGIVDEGCLCGELAERPCYPGDPDKAGVGACSYGTMFCNPGGESWGPCQGFVLPAPFEVCDGQDTNCNGIVDDGCNCTEEICDGQDNNCSGFADDGLRCTDPDSPAFGRCFDELPSEERMQADMLDNPNSWIELCPSGNCCDGLDNNCDGLIDHGLLNACGNCDEWCYEETWDNPTRWAEGETSSLDPDFSEGLRLGEGRVETTDLWIANTGDGTVTRIDTENATVVGTYPTHGIQPSRTAVDVDGNVWVANRALDLQDGTRRQGSITRIGVDCPCTGNCATGANALPTNRPWTDAGSTSPNGDFDSGDRCIVGPIEIGPPGAWVRGLAIDLNGYIWAGTHSTSGNRHALYRIHPETFEVTRFDTPVRVYGLAVDQDGLMWIAAQNAGSQGGIGCFDTNTLQPCEVNGVPRAQFRSDGSFSNLEVSTFNGASSEIRGYGIAIDQLGNVWLGNWTAESMIRFDREAFLAGTPRADIYGREGVGDVGQSRGTAIDGEGYVYMVWSSGNRLSKFDPNTREWVWSASTCGAPAGVGIAGDGNIWVMCLNSSQAQQFDPDGVLLATLPTGPSPYSYSDLTGFQLFNVVAPRGTWRTTFDCGREACSFDEILWEATTPPGSVVSARIRTREEPTDDWSAWSSRVTESPGLVAGQTPRGRYAQVELQLEAGVDRLSPVVRRVDVRWQRP
ncbi:MAG: hypothetical protein EA398_00430 [Deltaproteobacteria bacterium]|nr:MAG: hypothetical protein EA398_00430 [Deltaproteobacteria bacterium]